MGSLSPYSPHIKAILPENASFYKGSTKPLDLKVIINPEETEFLLLMLGWDVDTYSHPCLTHLSLENGKIWIHQNTMDFSIEEELLRHGIAASDIVLGLKHPDYRKYTNFAVA